MPIHKRPVHSSLLALLGLLLTSGCTGALVGGEPEVDSPLPAWQGGAGPEEIVSGDSQQPSTDGGTGGVNEGGDAGVNDPGGGSDGGQEPATVPLISRNVPAHASSGVATRANDSDYGSSWAPSGPPSAASPAWIALDLSGVPSAQRGRVVVVWYGDPSSGHYDFSFGLDGQTPRMPGLYRVDVHPAPGGSAPAANDSGWVTLATVASQNVYHSRQHVVSLTNGSTVYNWVRLYITQANTSSTAPSLNLDVHDAHAGLDDDWIFYGDSISEMSMSHDPKRGVCPAPCALGDAGTFAELVAVASPARFPIQENGGTGGLHAYEAVEKIDQWLALFPGKYVGIAFGSNDAWNSSTCNQSCSDTFYRTYSTLVSAVISAGKVPVVPTIPWARLSYIQTNAPILNRRIHDLYTAYPQIIPGPDLWTFFQSNQSLISGDQVHPTAQGQLAYRNLWVQTVLQHAP